MSGVSTLKRFALPRAQKAPSLHILPQLRIRQA
ncbi:Uncharacterised protein [Bordetella pertussis]|nr:Uncharacterised protein [Bordetella pertussis]